jgi:preprotein translocase subunit SecE
MEMKKVTYPTQKQTLTTCASVLVVVVVISLFLGVVDLALSKILEVVLP